MQGITNNPAAIAVANLCYLQSLYGVTDEVLASKIGISRGTWHNRKQRPQQMTLKELNLAVSFFGNYGFKTTVPQLMIPFRIVDIEPQEVTA